MNIQEREIELKYINKIIERLSEDGDAIYKTSPAYANDNYVFTSSSIGMYDPAEGERLEEEAHKWKRSDEAKRYIEIVERIGKLTIIRDHLQEEQERYVIDKYDID